jgi:SAM-dependent methyltransferase
MLNFVRRNSDRFKLTSVDALAENYAELMEQHGYDVPRNMTCYAEDLDTIFHPKTFDIIFASNSIDHTVDVTESLHKMAVILKDDGFIYVLCNINEKDRQGGEGMHSHNVNLTNGCLTDDGKPVYMPYLEISDFHMFTQSWTVGEKVFEAPRFEVILRKTS